MKRVAIVGGGIAGLSIAHAIRSRDPLAQVVVLERGDRAGGNVRSEVVDGYTCEWGPDGFLDNAPDTLRLIEAVGLADRVCRSRDAARRRFVYRDGRLNELPAGPGAFLKSPLLSVAGKARLAWEPFAHRRPDQDETIHEFAARRIGAEAASILVDSMVSGVFAGDARTLSLRACFPRMWELETEYGGLFRAMLALRKQRRRGDAMGAPSGTLTSFAGGMEDLIRGVASTLGSAVRTSAGAIAIRKDTPTCRFSLSTTTGIVEADALVLAGPSSDAASLLKPYDPTLSALLAGIATAPLVVVCLGYDEGAVARDRGALDGFGFLVPRNQGIRILGALWETSIYPHRAPEGKALIRVMIGGARDPHVVDLDDAELLRIVRSELTSTMGLHVGPEFVRIIRRRRGIPQYTVGHLARLDRIDTCLDAHPGLYLAGNSYRGVSINSCVAEAGPIAERVLADEGTETINSEPAEVTRL
jgi:oxygen-dependent protoporphyrinogen oxidase